MFCISLNITIDSLLLSEENILEVHCVCCKNIMYAKFEASHTSTTSIVHNAETERFSFVHTALCKK